MVPSWAGRSDHVTLFLIDVHTQGVLSLPQHLLHTTSTTSRQPSRQPMKVFFF